MDQGRAAGKDSSLIDDDPEFEALIDFLKESRGFDFSGYKRSSLMRRIALRSQAVGLTNWTDYVDYLQVHQEEFTALFNTVLINVTGFFRDQDAWGHLRSELLPKLLAAKKPAEMIRVWCAGCATGEEAYTIAMVLTELLGPDEFRDRVKIYATDVDDEALAVARQASYGAKEIASIPPELLERYFERSGSRYILAKDLRRGVIFGRNDLVQDAPISRVDLLTCRNTLMYLNADTQAQILSRFNFALNDNGLLFLGKAEMLLSHSQLFTPIDLKRRFFRKVARPALPMGTLSASLGGRSNPLELAASGRLQAEALLSSPVATVVILEDGTVTGANQRAEALFGVTPRDVGRLVQDLDLFYRPVELRPYLDEVQRDRRAIWIRDVEWSRSAGERLYLDLQIMPLVSPDGKRLGAAIFGSDVSKYRKLQDELEFANRQIETAYEELQSTNEELETTNEELQSTIEELETTNEELQSTNEELETMNEELQSTNDELQTINDELRERTDQLNDANAFLESILRGSRNGVIVVDTELVVQAWNRQSEELWGLRPEEVVGQHLLNLDIGVPTEQLRPLIRQVIAGSDGPTELIMDAVNRRGRQVQIRVGASPLVSRAGQNAGAIVLMDQLESAG